MKSKPNRKLNLYLGKHRNDLKLNWKSAKQKYPKLKPLSDSDFDGTMNKKDCRPLNPAMDARKKSKIKKIAKAVPKIHTVSPTERIPKIVKRTLPKVIKVTEKTIKKFKPSKKELQAMSKAMKKVGGTAMKKLSGETSSQKRVKSGPGRPAGVYKHISPLTGKAVPAPIFYQHRKAVRRRMKARAEQERIREQRIMARRGVPPVVTRMRQERRMQPPPEQEEVPQEVEGYEEPQEVMEEEPQQVQPQQPQQIYTQQIQPQQRYKIVTDIMTGRQIIKSIPPQERWTR